MRPTNAHKCRDCRMAPELPATVRPIAGEGRCATHLRLHKRKKRLVVSTRLREKRYGLNEQQQLQLWQFQGERCGGCGVVVGPKAKRAAVDHDHSICGPEEHAGDLGCVVCVRGLLCYRCNDTLAKFRDDAHALRRLADYLDNPPWQALRNPPESRGEPRPEPETDGKPSYHDTFPSYG